MFPTGSWTPSVGCAPGGSGLEAAASQAGVFYYAGRGKMTFEAARFFCVDVLGMELGQVLYDNELSDVVAFAKDVHSEMQSYFTTTN